MTPEQALERREIHCDYCDEHDRDLRPATKYDDPPPAYDRWAAAPCWSRGR